MVEAKSSIFFVIGEDSSNRKRAIENIKKKILPDKSAELNTLIFYSNEIEINKLRQSIFTFSFDKKKILIFKEAENLTQSVKKFLLENLKKITSVNYIIFEITKAYPKLGEDKKFKSDKFLSFLFKQASVFKVSSAAAPLTLEDFKWSIRRRDFPKSIYILEKLFEWGKEPKYLGTQILGILVQEFSYLKAPIERKKYFSYLWEADRAIKEKGLQSRLVIEMLLAKLITPDRICST